MLQFKIFLNFMSKDDSGCLVFIQWGLAGHKATIFEILALLESQIKNSENRNEMKKTLYLICSGGTSNSRKSLKYWAVNNCYDSTSSTNLSYITALTTKCFIILVGHHLIKFWKFKKFLIFSKQSSFPCSLKRVKS